MVDTEDKEEDSHLPTQENLRRHCYYYYSYYFEIVDEDTLRDC